MGENGIPRGFGGKVMDWHQALAVGAIVLLILFLFWAEDSRSAGAKSSGRSREHRNAANVGASGQGQEAELWIESNLNRYIKGSFTVFRNVYVPTKGRTAEIDVVMLHKKGIFVFESKDYSGWIFGGATQLYWTQSFPNGVKYQFYNPVQQNANHIKALANYLGLPTSLFMSYIVFSDRCSLKSIPENTCDMVITHQEQLIREVNSDLANAHGPLFTRRELSQMSAKIKARTRVSKAVKRKHIRDIQTKCLFCGSPLKLYKGKQGKMWRCTNYPKCKFTRPAD